MLNIVFNVKAWQQHYSTPADGLNHDRLDLNNVGQLVGCYCRSSSSSSRGSESDEASESAPVHSGSLRHRKRSGGTGADKRGTVRGYVHTYRMWLTAWHFYEPLCTHIHTHVSTHTYVASVGFTTDRLSPESNKNKILFEKQIAKKNQKNKYILNINLKKLYLNSMKPVIHTVNTCK